MKKILLLLLALISIQISYSQQGKGLSNTVDNTGYCYVTGVVNDAYSGSDILVVKYDLYGDTLWTRTYSGTDHSPYVQGVAVKTGINGDVYVVGNIANTGNGLDVVLLKYSADGNLVRYSPMPEINTMSDDKAFGIALDQNDNVYITGSRQGSNSIQMFTAMYNSDCVYQWVGFDGVSGMNASGVAIALDHSGNVCVTGYTSTSNEGNDIMTVKYNSGGRELWNKTVNGNANSDDRPFGIAVDEQDNVIIAGYITNHPSNPNTDIAVIKYYPSGDVAWAQSYGDSVSNDKALGIAVDETDAIYVTGYAANSLGGKNYSTLKLDPTYGGKLWNTIYPGGSNDQANSIGLIKNNGTTVGVVVTGQSVGADNTNDYATVGYDVTSGDQQLESRYTATSSSDDVAEQLAVSNDGTIYVTGYSQVRINARTTSVFKTQSLKWNAGKNHTLSANLPHKFALYQNYPNPFNPSTKIIFDLAKETNVKIVVYDLLGRQISIIADSYMKAGSHEISFNGSDLSSGIYFYELRTDGFREVRKMSLIK